MLTCICTQCLDLLSLVNEPEAKSIPPSQPCCMCGQPDERQHTGQGHQVLTLGFDPRAKLRARDFLCKLAVLLDEYAATMNYTTADDGIHISLEGEEVFVGWINDTSELRQAAGA